MSEDIRTRQLQDPPSHEHQILRAIAGLAIGFVLAVSVYNAIRIKEVYENAVLITNLQNDVVRIRMEHDTALINANARLDQIEKTMFGDLIAKIEKIPLDVRAAAQVGAWQENRDKELRERILRLERWRAEQERQERERER